MAGKPRSTKRIELKFTVSEDTMTFLQTMVNARAGGVGSSPAEIARNIVENKVSEWVQSGYLGQARKAVEDRLAIEATTKK